jgi:multiple sugar transport system permease protein
MGAVAGKLTASSERPQRWHVRRMLRRGARYLALLLGAVIMVVPFAYMVGISFTANAYVLQMPPSFIPSSPTWQNYVAAWNGNSFGQAFVNSLFIAVSATAVSVGLASALAFAFARYRFPGRNILFYGMLSTMLVPSIVLIIPQFVLASHLHLTNSRFGLFLVYAATNGTAFSVFLLRNFFEELPQELMDAAAIDGSGVWGSFLRIGIPLARPALSAAVIFAFLGNWDEFPWAVTSLNNQNLFTLPVAIQQFQSNNGTQWGIVFAGSTIAVLPVIIVFLIFQRQFIQGISVGAIKG